MLTLDIKVKELFFDRPRVIQAIGRPKATFLSRGGARVHRVAKNSIPRRKRVSLLAIPPSAHSRNPNAWLKRICFGFQESSESVIIGPVAVNAREVLVRGLASGEEPSA